MQLTETQRQYIEDKVSPDLSGDYPKLFSRDSKNRIRVWNLSLVNDGKLGRISKTGVSDGKIMVSSPHYTIPKNVGKANGTTVEEQMHQEILSIYTRKMEGGWTPREFGSPQQVSEFTPMLAGSLSDGNIKKILKAKSFPLFYQPKLDGIRCNVFDGVSLSRNGKPIVSVPHVLEELEDIAPSVHFDGELYAHTKEDNFNEIVSAVKKTKVNDEILAKSKQFVKYHVYDMYDEDNPDLTFQERSEILKALVEGMEYVVWVETTELAENTVETITKRARELETESIVNGYEGGMLRANTAYEQKRTYNLQKVKSFLDDEFEIVEVLEGKGNWTGAAKSLRCKAANGKSFNAGLPGSFEDNVKILQNKHVIDNAGLQATVTFQNYSEYGIPRFPIVKTIHATERW